jgi:sugar phosphate isomerase/epimerase
MIRHSPSTFTDPSTPHDERLHPMAQARIAVRLSSFGAPLRQSLAAAASLGVKAVQLDAGPPLKLSELSATGIRQLRKLVSDFDMKIAAIRFQTRRGYDTLEGLSRRVDATKTLMATAYELGAPLLINRLGDVPEKTDDPRYQTLVEVVSDLGRHGTRVGTFFAAETGSEPGASLAKLLESDHNAFVAAALNPGTLIINRFGCGEAIRALGDRIRVVVATDGVVDLSAGRGVTVPIGQGTADYPEILAELENRGFSGHLIVGEDQPHPEALQRLADTIGYLQNL